MSCCLFQQNFSSRSKLGPLHIAVICQSVLTWNGSWVFDGWHFWSIQIILYNNLNVCFSGVSSCLGSRCEISIFVGKNHKWLAASGHQIGKHMPTLTPGFRWWLPVFSTVKLLFLPCGEKVLDHVTEVTWLMCWRKVYSMLTDGHGPPDSNLWAFRGLLFGNIFHSILTQSRGRGATTSARTSGRAMKGQTVRPDGMAERNKDQGC